MNALLSLFLTLAMVMSGGYYADDPTVQSSYVTTISDAVVTVDGTEYTLAPSLVFGVTTEGESALLDFHMPYGEDTLFPVQAKVTEEGISLMLGSSTTAYTLTKDLLNEVLETEDETAEALEAYEAMLTENLAQSSALTNYKPSDETLAEIQAKATELLGDPVEEDVPFTLDGEELVGQRYTATIDRDQLCEMADMVFDPDDGALGEWYYSYLNTMLSATGEDVQFHSFSELLDYAGMTVTADIDSVANETSGIVDMVMHFTIENGDEPVTFDLPIHEIVYDEDTCEITIEMDMDEWSENLILNLNIFVDGDDATFTFLMTDDEDTLALSMDVFTNEDGSMTQALLMNLTASEDDVAVEFAMNSEIAADMSQNTHVNLAVTTGGTPYGVSFNVTGSREPLEDRFSGATEQRITSSEELENASGLMTAVMGMAGDVEKLMNDEDIMALAQVIQDMTYTPYDDYGYTDTYDSVDPIDLPTFTYLPEGYVLDKDSIYNSYGSASMEFVYSVLDDDEYHSTLYVSIYEADGATNTYTTLDGTESMSGSVVNIQRVDDSVSAECILNDLEIRLSFYDDMDDDEILKIFNGIVFDAAEAEVPAEVEAPADAQ